MQDDEDPDKLMRIRADDLHLYVETKKSDSNTLEWSAPPIPFTWCGKIRTIPNEKEQKETHKYKWGNENRICSFEEAHVLRFHVFVIHITDHIFYIK